VGPFNLGVAGRIDAAAMEGALDRGRITLKGGRLTVGDVVLALNASVDTLGEAPVIDAQASVPAVPASQLVASIPKGLMPHLLPVEAKGRFGFEGALHIDFAKLKETKLTAKVDTAGLTLSKLPAGIDFAGLATRFDTRFEMPDGTIIERTTGPESERWTPLEAMPPLMPLAVITQEDGGFRRHGGISMFHLRASLVRNLEQGRFARGGSTLTMQLARNVFLNRKKTLARKLEELVLTWLLEKSLSKDELITLYLNVVEFAPEVFGIGDAARHYFDKTPAQMDPVEMVFLTRLLPAPRRWGKQKGKGKVEKWYAKRMVRLLDLLTTRGHLSQAERDACRPTKLWQGATMDPLAFPSVGVDGLPLRKPWAPALPEPVMPEGGSIMPRIKFLPLQPVQPGGGPVAPLAPLPPPVDVPSEVWE
jgi:hypothetical protein